jgi:hypothetical protein
MYLYICPLTEERYKITWPMGEEKDHNLTSILQYFFSLETRNKIDKHTQEKAISLPSPLLLGFGRN